MALSNELRRAVENGQSKVYYLPIVDLLTGELCKAEAPLRWHHPQRGDISPVEFIPIAEHTGPIARIGNWVFELALARARAWLLTINVNVSSLQFYEGDGKRCRKWLGKGTLGETIIVMAHKLGLLVIAEGVETRQQADLLRRAGCDFSQGFLFGHAMPAQQFETMLGN